MGRWHQVGLSEGGDHIFSGTYWSRATADHWEIPLAAVAAYLVMIPLLKRLVAWRGRFDVKGFAFWWNASLSLFSWCGVAACCTAGIRTRCGSPQAPGSRA